MHIVGLEVENFQRIKAVSLKPDGTGSVIVSGRNAQGKSSLLDAIWATLGGPAGNKSARPVRDGAAQARVELDLGDMIVTRIWRNGTSAVRVRSKDGAEFKSPQTLLDTFIGRNTFDPLAFTRLKAREQKDALMQLVTLDVDLDVIDGQRAQLFNERTEVGQRKTALGAAPEVNEELPAEQTSASEILDRVRSAQEVQALNRADEAKLAQLIDDHDSLEREIVELAERTKMLADRKGQVAAHLAAQRVIVEDLPEPEDYDALQVELAEVETRNAEIRVNNTARELAAMIADRDIDYKALTASIAKIDEDKAAALARAEFPVVGLGFDADGVTFNGVPFSVASSAEQIRVSMAMAIAANPKLRVARIMDGSLLDAEGMKIITDLAKDSDFQVWVERVANGDGIGFEIEDGELVDG